MCEELIGEVTACREQRQDTGGVARCHILPEAFVPFCFLRCLLCIMVCLGNKWDRGVAAVVYRLDKESNYDLGRRVSAICILQNQPQVLQCLECMSPIFHLVGV